MTRKVSSRYAFPSSFSSHRSTPRSSLSGHPAADTFIPHRTTEDAQRASDMSALARLDAERSFLFWQCLDAAQAQGDVGLRRFATSDFGPPERWQHSGRVVEPTEEAGVFRVRATEECVLDYLALHGVLNRAECIAGLHLKRDFLDAGLAAQIVAKYDRCYTFLTVEAALRERTVQQEAAYQRWRSAIKSLKNNLIVNALISVVCCDEMPREEHHAFIKLGLTRLEIYYEKLTPVRLCQNVNQRAARQVR